MEFPWCLYQLVALNVTRARVEWKFDLFKAFICIDISVQFDIHNKFRDTMLYKYHGKLRHVHRFSGRGERLALFVW